MWQNVITREKFETVNCNQNMKPDKRRSWSNHNGEFTAHPLNTWTPERLNDLRAIVLSAYNGHGRVKAVGSGHSFMDICHTTGHLIRPNGLNNKIDLDTSVLNNTLPHDKLFHAQSGMTIRKLNDLLDRNGLALSNMGGYDGQTIIGATCTSTHGSGVSYGPLCDMIRSFEVVVNKGEVFRIEPANGITDPAAFALKYPDIKLLQNDDLFNSMLVSLGCLGAVYSVIIEVVPAYYLQEIRTLSTWSEIKNKLKTSTILEDHDHIEFLLNPHPNEQGVRDGLITTRNPKTDTGGLKPKDKKRNFWVELGSGSKLVTSIILGKFNKKPENSHKLLSTAIKALVDNSYWNKSYKVFNIGAANGIQSYSSEIMVPMKNHRYIEAADHMLKVIAENAKRGKLYHTGPISLRFVKASNAYLSPFYKIDCCVFEIIMLKKTFGAYEMYDIIEKELYQFDARVHWGQIISATPERIKTMYPKLDRWKAARDVLDERRIFSNHYSDRFGL